MSQRVRAGNARLRVNRTNLRNQDRQLTFLTATEHGAVFAEPMLTSEVFDHCSLARELRAVKENLTGSSHELEATTVRRCQRPGPR